MTDKLIAVPGGSEGFVALGRTKTGRLFKKHILNMGELLYPGVKGGKVTIDDAFVATLSTNFQNGVCDIVQVPKAGANNEHTEDPDRNIGEVTGLSVEDNKVYALIDARTDDADKLGKTLLGASAMMSLNYKDTKTGEFVGPTLLHVAITNRPYVTNLEGFSEVQEEILAASAEYNEEVVFLTPVVAEKEPVTVPATKDELLAELKTLHGIDVEALQTAAANPTKDVELTNQIAKALEGIENIKLSNTDGAAKTEDVLGAVATLVENNVALSNSNDALNVRLSNLEKSKVDAEIAGLVKEGRVLPAQVADFTEIALSNRAMFDRLVPNEPLIKMSNEMGGTPIEQTPEEDINEAIARLTAQGKANGLDLK